MALIRKSPLIVCIATIVLAHFTTIVAAEPSDKAVSTETFGYCDYMRETARAENFLLVLPSVFTNFGLVNGNSSIDANLQTLSQSLRLTIGLSYNLTNIYRAILQLDISNHDCKRFSSLQTIRQHMATNGRDLTARALAARSAVLQNALPQAEKLVKKIRKRVRDRKATLSELLAIEMRVDQLQRLEAETKIARASLPDGKDTPASPQSAFKKHTQAVEDLESSRAKMRMARAWDVSVQGGYDQFFARQNRLPLFAVISLSFNFGAFFQPSAGRKIKSAASKMAQQQLDRVVGSSLIPLNERLEKTRTIVVARRKQAHKLLSSLDERLSAFASLRDARAQSVRDQMWLDKQRLAAEKAYLDAYLEDLNAVLGSNEPTI